MPNLDDESRLSVLDLPQLHHKPSAATLLDTLSQLAIHPSSFSESHRASLLKVDEAGITGYLTRYIASPLVWITSKEEKEKIWEAASQRLSERSGRMAMSSITRTFTICDRGIRRDGTAPRYISIQINEPSMTEDNVGHKTWAGSFLLAERLPFMMTSHFPTLLPSPSADVLSSVSHQVILPIIEQPIEPKTTPIRVLELGSGTGLTGITAAALFPNITVHLSDLPSIVPNLVANVETNKDLFVHYPTAGTIDWSNLPNDIAPCEQYDCVLAADSLYDPQHPDWLTNAILIYLTRRKEARVMIELPFRDMDLPYHNLLRENMGKKGFVLLEEGTESGYDDWEGAWCEKMAVMCWWSVWGWAESQFEQTEAVEEGKEEQEEAQATGPPAVCPHFDANYAPGPH